MTVKEAFKIYSFENGQHLAWFCFQVPTVKKELATKDIGANMVATLENDASILSAVQRGQLNLGEKGSLEDDSRSESPTTATTEEKIDRLKHMVIVP